MQGFVNLGEMFAQSIGLSDPWQIARAEYDEGAREVHVYMKTRKTAQYPCAECGEMRAQYVEARYLQQGVLCYDSYSTAKRVQMKKGVGKLRTYLHCTP